MAGSSAAMFLAFRERALSGVAAHIREIRDMANDEFEQDAHSQQDSRLTSLDARLDKAKREEALRTGNKPSEESQRLIRSVGMRILSDLIGLPFGAALIGWLIDRWAGTTPWVMLVMLFLGFGLAVRSVLRAANQRPPEGTGK